MGAKSVGAKSDLAPLVLKWMGAKSDLAPLTLILMRREMLYYDYCIIS